MFSSAILPIVYDDPCVTPPNNICVEKGIYIDTIQLPFNPSGYHISYQRCCWANNIDNIVDPGNNGITLTTFIPGSALTAEIGLMKAGEQLSAMDLMAVDPVQRLMAARF